MQLPTYPLCSKNPENGLKLAINQAKLITHGVLPRTVDTTSAFSSTWFASLELPHGHGMPTKGRAIEVASHNVPILRTQPPSLFQKG